MCVFIHGHSTGLAFHLLACVLSGLRMVHEVSRQVFATTFRYSSTFEIFFHQNTKADFPFSTTHATYAANAKKYATNAVDAAVTSSQKPKRKNSIAIVASVPSVASAALRLLRLLHCVRCERCVR